MPILYSSDKTLKFTLKLGCSMQEHRAKIVELYFSCNGSIKAMQGSYKVIFDEERSPDKSCMLALVSKFKEMGSLVDKWRSDRPRTVRTDVSIQDVSESVAERPTSSTRKRSTKLIKSRRLLQLI